jgi:copper chaperone CopZ
MKFSNIFVLTIAFMLVSTTATFAQSATEKVQMADTTKTIETKVKGITCSTDLKMISANVEKLKGVSNCKAGKTGTTTTFEIAYNPSLITEKEIYAAIENTGSCENPDERPYKIKQ